YATCGETGYRAGIGIALAVLVGLPCPFLNSTMCLFFAKMPFPAYHISQLTYICAPYSSALHCTSIVSRPSQYLSYNLIVAVVDATRSITHVPSIGTYCRVIILIASWATRPPTSAAVVGNSAVGARCLSPSAALPSSSASPPTNELNTCSSREKSSSDPGVGGRPWVASNAKSELSAK
ncbi:unnamed protein product, partial [Rhizoctonia solani]